MFPVPFHTTTSGTNRHYSKSAVGHMERSGPFGVSGAQGWNMDDADFIKTAVSLSNPPPQEFQTFMLNIATNHVPDDVGDMEWALLNLALYQLKLSGDTNALVVLKSQTNGPSWKLEKIKKTVRSIENRHDSSSVRQHELEL